MTSVHSELSQYIENIEKYRKRFDRRSIEFRKVPIIIVFPLADEKRYKAPYARRPSERITKKRRVVSFRRLTVNGPNFSFANPPPDSGYYKFS